MKIIRYMVKDAKPPSLGGILAAQSYNVPSSWELQEETIFGDWIQFVRLLS